MAIQQQYGRATHQPTYVGATGGASGKQDHSSHLARPQQLKSPLQVLIIYIYNFLHNTLFLYFIFTLLSCRIIKMVCLEEISRRE